MLSLKKSFLISGIILFGFVIAKYQKEHTYQYVITTPPGERYPRVLFNNEELIPPFASDTNTYHVISANTLKPNILQIGDIKKEIKIENFEMQPTVSLKINGQKIKIHLYSNEYPKYSMKNHIQAKSNNYISITPFTARCDKPAFNFIISEEGTLVFYRRTRIDICASDFKQTTLVNGEKVYSYMQQEKAVPPFHYLGGSLVLMNDKFEVIDSLTIQKTDKHPALMIENHDSLILDKNHYILSAYHETEILNPETEKPVFVAESVIQEIKDGKVVFDWVSSDYPELYTHFKYPNYYFDQRFHDYMHFNSIIIDPKDNNFIVSFASQSSVVKLNRQTGEIMWTLGGSGDDFKLDEKYHFFGQHSLSFDDKGNLMLFDNQSIDFAARIIKDPKLLEYSRILKFKLDEENKQILYAEEIPLDFQTKSMGSVYQTDKDTYLIAKGNKNTVEKIKVENGKTQKIWELSLTETPTYRAYEIRQ